MSIKNITTDDVRRMINKEGLVLQGCGGNLQEWVDGINDVLTEDKILLDNTKFKAEDCSVFEHNKSTCILYPFENVKLNMGKLAMWRLQTHASFGGTWLSDFVPNQLGGYITEHIVNKNTLKNYIFHANFDPIYGSETVEYIEIQIPANDETEAWKKLEHLVGDTTSLFRIDDERPY